MVAARKIQIFYNQVEVASKIFLKKSEVRLKLSSAPLTTEIYLFADDTTVFYSNSEGQYSVRYYK